MTTNINAPTVSSQSAMQNNSKQLHYNPKQNPPPFPANGKHAHHARAALVMLLRGDESDQYEYNRKTGFPCTDYRTRISELYLSGWPIMRAFHWGIDHERQSQRCKHYWLDLEYMRELFQRFPEFEGRCRLLMEKGVAHA